jgi:hypothetical protein
VNGHRAVGKHVARVYEKRAPIHQPALLSGRDVTSGTAPPRR